MVVDLSDRFADVARPASWFLRAYLEPLPTHDGNNMLCQQAGTFNSPCHNFFQALIDLASHMFWRVLVKAESLCGFRLLRESSGKAISRLAAAPLTLRLN